LIGPENILSIVYLFALVAVCVVLLGVLLEAVVAVSRQPPWSMPSRSLTLLPSVDLREQALPFVGVERRRATAIADSQQAETDRKSA
jgi:hypothetical protein